MSIFFVVFIFINLSGSGKHAKTLHPREIHFERSEHMERAKRQLQISFPPLLTNSIPALAGVSDFLTDLNPIPGLDIAAIGNLNFNPDPQFYLYTRANFKVPYTLITGNMENLHNSPLNPGNPVKIIVHGWMNTHQTEVFQTMKNTYLTTGDINVILVDWGATANNLLYPVTALQTHETGRKIGFFINFLVKNNVHPIGIHLIGHSLGAHVVGSAGDTAEVKVGRITGLDPAKPGYEGVQLQHTLDFNDAHFVDVIHTSVAFLGYKLPLGHADFYPNGMEMQRSCVIFKGVCSHVKSVEYFINSIISPNMYPALRCDSWQNYQAGVCDGEKVEPMGDGCPHTARGTYFVAID